MMKNGNLNETQMVMQLCLKYRYCLNQYNEKEKTVCNPCCKVWEVRVDSSLKPLQQISKEKS